jgi:voltage-gated potassium channel
MPYTRTPEGRRRTVRRLRTGLLGVLLVVVAGTVGYLVMGYTVVDALFQTIITVTTVGFGEVHQFGTAGELFTIVLIIAGVGTAAYTFSVLIETLVEGYLADLFGRRRMEQRIASMRAHVIVCGWGRVGRSIAAYLRAARSDLVVIDSSPERVATIDVPYVFGDAADEKVLRAAGIDRARVLVTALPADADNVYVTLTARSMHPDLFVVARAASEQAVAKLLQAGADRVVNPQDLGGIRMAALAVQPHVAEFLDVVMHDGSLKFRLEQVQVRPDSPLVGQSLHSARVQARTGTLVLAMRHPGSTFHTNPPPEAEIASGDVLIVIGDTEQVRALRALASAPSPAGAASGD